jgi:adhesin/invasin
MNRFLISTAVIATTADFAPQALAEIGSVSDSSVKNIVSNLDENYEIPNWLERTEFQVDLGGKPTWSVLTVQPLYQSEDLKHTIFTQLSAMNYEEFGSERPTSNIGVGYRQLVLEDKLLLGANAFYDREWEHEHERLGFGVEARSNAVEVNANYYDAVSGLRDITTAVTEQALDGYDAEIGVQVPYLPWAKVFAKTYEWEGDVGRDTNGQTYSVRLQPAPWLEVEAGTDDSNNYDRENFLKMNFRLAFDDSGYETVWVDNKPFAFEETMKEKTLDKVRRTNKIVVERVSTAGGGGGSLTVVVGRGS